MKYSLSDQTLAYSEQILTATLGLDQVYRKESGDEEGLVVVNMSPSHKAEDLADYENAAKRFQELKILAAELEEADRRLYYRQYCSSMLDFMKWRKGELPFEDQISGFLHVDPQPASDEVLQSMRSRMKDNLENMGYIGSLADMCAAWEEKNRVPEDQISIEFSKLMDEAWRRTNEHLPIPAPKSDAMKVKTVSGKAFNARCNYLKRTVELNTDPILTYPGLKHLVTHEGCPGHYLQFKLREVWYSQGTAPADGLISVVNTASSTTFEGIADNGINMLNWEDNADDRFSMLMGSYRAGIGTAAAWRLHKLGEDAEQVTKWLRSVNLIGGEGWVRNRMAFLKAPQRSVLIWSYWCGEPSVGSVYNKLQPVQHAGFYRYLYGRMHSPQSVAMFEASN